MKVFYYSIYDKDAKEFGPLFQAKNDILAIRAYKQTMNGVPEEVKESYSLHCMFEMDTEVGQLAFPFDEYEVPIEKKGVDVNVNN